MTTRKIDDGNARTHNPAPPEMRVLTHAQMLDRLLGTDDQVTRVLLGSKSEHEDVLSALHGLVNMAYVVPFSLFTWIGRHRNVDLRFYDPTTEGDWSLSRCPGPCAIFCRLDRRGHDLVLPQVREGDTLYLVLPPESAALVPKDLPEPQACDDGNACTAKPPGIGESYIDTLGRILAAFPQAKVEIDLVEDVFDGVVGCAVSKIKVQIN